MPNKNYFRMVLSIFVLFTALNPPLYAGEGPGGYATKEEEAASLDEVVVIGSKEKQVGLPGSGQYVDKDDIRNHTYDDLQKALRKVPGIYFRDEDGNGLFVNASLRGADTTRTAKVTVMEDGVITAPATYSAPSAYYIPATGRMHGIEVLKGSSQVKYGPHTTGGVLNYLSAPVPSKKSGYLKASYGTDDEIRLHTSFGDTLQTGIGKIGFVIEEYYRETDGFKKIDETPDFKDTDRTGFTRSEPMLKLFWEPETDFHQRLSWKIGYTDLDSDETYLGISTTDFRNGDPYRRYAASRFDHIETKQFRTYLRYDVEPNDDWAISTTAYYNDFQRNWFKLHDLPGAGKSTLSQALLDPASVAILKGEAAGTLRYRNNDRAYEAWGIQSTVATNFGLGETEHDVEFGVRYHEDWVDRVQSNVSFTQAADGSVTASTTSAPGAGGNDRNESEAWAFHLKDSIRFGNWTLHPGVRYETIDYDFTQRDTSGPDPDVVTSTASSSLDVWGGGVGAVYDVNDAWRIFGGVHRGFSVPSPKSNAVTGLNEETSVNYEIGARYNPDRLLSSELVFFYTDFSDLIVIDNIGGTGTGDSENVGDVDSIGVEFQIAYDVGQALGWGFENPYFFSFTYTDATLDGDANSADAESIFSGGKDGNQVPYIPEFQFTVGGEWHIGKWHAFLTGIWVDETFTSANNTEAELNAGGTADARFGKTDDYFIVDLSFHYDVNDNTKAFLNFANLFDKEYIVSRHPHGPRPGRPFTFATGIEMKF